MDFPDLPKQVDLHVEEPELSLDPDSQMSLLDDLVDNAFHTISQDRKMTIMFATHSPYLLNYVNLLMAKNDLDKDKGLKPENTMVYIVDSGRLISVMGRDVKNRIIVDTNSMAEQMERIYNDYVEIRS
jgi:predicted ATPase